MPEDLLDVGIGHFEEFNQKVFDVHLIVRLRKAQACG
jgi:hypothetical protein